MKSVPQAAFLIGELVFTTSRSSGPGGQNVNKVNSKVTLRFDVVNSALLSTEEKDIILKKLATKITNEGVLVLNAQESRSQLQNKEDVMANFDSLLKKAFEKKKARKKTKPSKSAVAKRIKSKKQTSEKKKWRQKPI
jgi:ribosome-associated protein